MAVLVAPPEKPDADEKPDAARAERIFASAAQATRFFMKQGDVYRTLERITDRLHEDGIPYALVGALALVEYGYQRFTVDVDLLLTRQGIEKFKAHHLGRGYVEKFPGSRGLRDAETGVEIDLVVAGDFPGDGLPKPVAFPDPATTAVRAGNLSLLPLNTLIELKLASGMSAPHRLKDLADVIELIRALDLDVKVAADLNAYVQEKYRELWTAASEHNRE